ncbi:hypothetical protein V8C42DRAFT_334075 [Trichoderma barbatum]
MPTHPCQPNSGTALFRLPARRVHSSASQDQQGSVVWGADSAGRRACRSAWHGWIQVSSISCPSLASSLAARGSSCRSFAEESAEARRLVTDMIKFASVGGSHSRDGSSRSSRSSRHHGPAGCERREREEGPFDAALAVDRNSSMNVPVHGGRGIMSSYLVVVRSSGIPYALPQHLERGLLRAKVRTGRPASASGQHLVASLPSPVLTHTVRVNA